MGEKLAVIVGEPASEHESAPMRSFMARKAPWSTPKGMENCHSVYALAKEGMKRFATKKAMGQREFIKLHVEEKEITKRVDGKDVKQKREWQYYELGPYQWITFGELDKLLHQLGAGLVHYGIKPGEDRVELYAKTCQEWMQLALASWSQSMQIVTAYDTLGPEGLSSSIQNTQAAAILTDKDNLGLLAKTLPDCPSIRLVVVRTSEGPFSEANKNDIAKIRKIREGGVQVIEWGDLIKAGIAHPVEPVPPKPTDICCIMYTSGSTGPPKGVVLLHSTVLAGVAGASGPITREYITENDVFLNILPLAHIFELTAELLVFVWGAGLGYGSPKTISDINMRNCVGDIRELRPTVMAAVPAVYEALKKGILAKVGSMPAATQKLFWAAYKFKTTMHAWHLPAPLVDRVVFRKIKDATGGRLRYVMCGGAALSRETRVFMETLVAPMLMGYGLTETNAMAALHSPGRLDLESTGELVSSATIKLVDVPETGYFSKNFQGELYIKGPSVAQGYFKNDKETKEAFTSDGWFMTGDIAEITPDGRVKVIDRKKNLIKTLNGEYIAVERLEALYRSNEYVMNMCIFADDAHVKPVAVVVPVENAIQKLCGQLGVEFNELAVHEPKVISAVLRSLQETAKSIGLKSVETLAAIVLSDEEWTPQNGYVTSAQKVQRKKIKEDYASGLKKAFEDA